MFDQLHRETGMAKDPAWLSDQDLHLFNEGNFLRAYEKLGAHAATRGGKTGTHFAVWAPSARHVSVVGTFNDWDTKKHPLKRSGASGIWCGFVPGVGSGTVYKYHV